MCPVIWCSRHGSRPHATVVAFGERSLNPMIGYCQGPTATLENIKPMRTFGV